MENQFQDFTHSPVPAERASLKLWYLTSLELAVAICVPVFVFGSFLGGALSIGQLIFVLLVSAIILAVLGGVSSYVGTATRLSTALLAQSVFGLSGAKLVQLILAISLFGWFGLQTEVFSKAFLGLLAVTGSAWQPSELWVTILAGVLMSSTAVIGIRAVGRLALYAVPFLLASFAYALWQSASLPLAAPAASGTLSIGLAIAAVVGAYSVGLAVRPDVMRFARSYRDSVGSAVAALAIGYPLLLLASAYLASVTGEPDFTKLIAGYGFGALSLVMLLLATWTTNDVNLYAASLSLSTLVPRTPRWILTAIAGAAGTLIATFGLFEKLVPLFSLMGIATTPLLVIYSMKYFLGRISHTFEPGIVWTPFAIWILSSFVGVMTTPAGSWGLGLFTLTTVPPLDSLIAAGILSAVWALAGRQLGLSSARA